MSQPTNEQKAAVQEAARHLMAQNDLYKLVVSYVAQEFDYQMRAYIAAPPDNQLFVEQGKAQALDYVLKTLRGG